MHRGVSVGLKTRPVRFHPDLPEKHLPLASRPVDGHALLGTIEWALANRGK